MELLSVNKEEYERIVKNNQYIYNAACFHEINKKKVTQLYYLLFKTKKYKFYVIAGVVDNIMKFPYSAPFGILESMSGVDIEEIENALELLEKFAKNQGTQKIMFRLPPMFYDEKYISKFQNCLIRTGYKIDSWDLNYYLVINNMQSLSENMKSSARNKLRIAQKHNFELQYCQSLEQKKEAYDVIKVNRKLKGYPLRMSWEQVRETIENVRHDFFVLYLEGKLVASAIIFEINSDIYQVIYWGDTGEYTEYKPMNYLAYVLYEYYMKKGIKILDIGPSTEDGIPNYGLCKFKESIGCEVCNKITFLKDIY